MTLIANRLARLEARKGDVEMRAVCGFSEDEIAQAEAELRATGFAGKVIRIVRTIIDPPAWAT
jgi:hypothetical protein